MGAIGQGVGRRYEKFVNYFRRREHSASDGRSFEDQGHKVFTAQIRRAREAIFCCAFVVCLFIPTHARSPQNIIDALSLVRFKYNIF